MGRKRNPDPYEEQSFREDYVPTKEQARAFKERKIEEFRQRREKEKAKRDQERQEPVINRMIDEDREDANQDGGPSRSPEEESARNDWAARYFSRNEHFGLGHKRND